MALTDYKIPEAKNKTQDVAGLITNPGPASLANQKFELLVKNILRPILNPLIDLLSPKIVGEIKALGGSAVPPGTLLCDGSAVSRSTYARLFATIGTTWGAGDNSTTFNLPPPGVMFIGAGTAASGTVYTLGQKGGAETHTLATAELPSGVLGTRSVNSGYLHEVDGLATDGAFGEIGRPDPNGQAFSIMPPYAVVNCVIVY
jgi:hypothetical protein